MSKSDNSISFGMGLLFGVVAGVGAGILLSPKSGEEMREVVKKKVNKFTEDNDPEIQYVKSKSNQVISRLTYTLEQQIEKTNTALKAARMAAAKRKEQIDEKFGE